MKNIIYTFVVLFVFSRCTGTDVVSDDANEIASYEILAETDSIKIISRVVQEFDDGFTIPLVQLSLKDKHSGTESAILTTVRPDDYSWYISDGLDFVPISIDSLFAAHRVQIINDKPLKLIVEGCPDMRNEFSYIVDVANRKAWYVPSNSGYLGSTEEGFLIFRSYRYDSNPDKGGRYTIQKVYNEEGVVVDSLDFEHCNIVE